MSIDNYETLKLCCGWREREEGRVNLEMGGIKILRSIKRMQNTYMYARPEPLPQYRGPDDIRHGTYGFSRFHANFNHILASQLWHGGWE